MFSHLHHKTWFPLVVIGLSLALILFVAWAYLSRPTSSDFISTEIPTVSVNQYKAESRKIMTDFWSQYRNQADDASALSFVSETEQKLLALKVPSENRSVHFELVSSLELMWQGIVGDLEKMSEGLARLEKTFSDNPWLSEE